MTRIAVLDDYLRCAAAAADWASFGAEIDFFYDTLHQIDALVARLAPYDVLVTMRERTRFPRAVLEKLPNLKLIAATGRRQANVDCEAANELGIMGLGRIGTVVAGYGRAFGMAVVAWGPTLDAERAAQSGVAYVAFDELFARSDVLSIQVLLSEQSRGLVAARELERMRRSAFLVNTARGAIVDQDALVAALKDGAIAGAALDVYAEEPLPADSPLLALDNVLLTPHLGYNTGATLVQFYEAALENVRACMAGAPTNAINEAVRDRRRT